MRYNLGTITRRAGTSKSIIDLKSLADISGAAAMSLVTGIAGNWVVTDFYWCAIVATGGDVITCQMGTVRMGITDSTANAGTDNARIDAALRRHTAIITNT